MGLRLMLDHGESGLRWDASASGYLPRVTTHRYIWGETSIEHVLLGVEELAGEPLNGQTRRVHLHLTLSQAAALAKAIDEKLSAAFAGKFDFVKENTPRETSDA